jgi:hypothetical protein
VIGVAIAQREWHFAERSCSRTKEVAASSNERVKTLKNSPKEAKKLALYSAAATSSSEMPLLSSVCHFHHSIATPLRGRGTFDRDLKTRSPEKG